MFHQTATGNGDGVAQTARLEFPQDCFDFEQEKIDLAGQSLCRRAGVQININIYVGRLSPGPDTIGAVVVQMTSEATSVKVILVGPVSVDCDVGPAVALVQEEITATVKRRAETVPEVIEGLISERGHGLGR